MALTKVTKGGITNDAVDGDILKDGAITTAKIGASAIESSEINDGTVIVDDLASTLNLSSKTVTLPNTSVTAGMLSNTLDLSSKTVTLSGSTVAALKQPIQDNIGLLGFKMAVNDGLTVFNLVDGVVDEFNDESGTDEAEGSNDVYCATEDSYANYAYSPFSLSAGFTTSTITEPDTSTAGTDANLRCTQGGSVPYNTGCGTVGSYTVPCGISSVNVYTWGAGGTKFSGPGGGGGFSSGSLAVTAGQTFDIVVGEYGHPQTSTDTGAPAKGPLGAGGGGGSPAPQGNLGSMGGGLSGIFGPNAIPLESLTNNNGPQVSAPTVFIVAGGGGGGGHGGGLGGAGGGLTGQEGGGGPPGTSTPNSYGGDGGTQCAGGATGSSGNTTEAAGFLRGADAAWMPRGGNPNVTGGSGGGGYYGGGAGGYAGTTYTGGGGGGSSYVGHPQLTCTSNEGGSGGEGGGTASPFYVAGTNEGGGPGFAAPSPPSCTTNVGEDGYVLFAASGCNATPGGSSTITSETFASGTVATSARIVVFEENVETPTLNTDIIASVSRDGTNFTTTTLSDSGYVTGSSGQRILTGQADISGQPSGQSMRWKLALANNTVKIHGVSLQWS